MKRLSCLLLLLACIASPGGTCSGQSMFVGSFADPYENQPGINGVLAYDPVTNAYQKVLAGVFDPIDFAFSPTGEIVGSSDIGDINRGVRDPGFVTAFDRNGNSKGDIIVPGGFGEPSGVAFGPSGDLFVADYRKNKIFRFDGTTYAYKSTFISSRMSGPLFIRFGPDGNLYVSSYSTGEVLVFDGNTGAFLSVFAVGGELILPVGLNFGPDGDLYVGSSGNIFGDKPRPHGVLRYDGKTGAFKGKFTNGLDFPAVQPAFGPGGDLWVTTGIERLVHRFDGKTGAYKSTLRNSDILGQTFGLAFTPAAKVLNVSTRLKVEAGDQALIGGFIVTGVFPKKVVVRAIGPSLTQAGVAGALQDPVLELRDGTGALVATNDNWKDTQETDLTATGIAPKNDAESAIVRTLQPGNYTAVVRGKNGGTGSGVVEVYDLNQSVESKLANISTRGFIGKGDSVMIGGFIVRPAGGGNTTAVARGIGPSLAAAGVSGALQDPFLELHDGNGALLASNDSWQDTQKAQIESYKLQPTDQREAAIVATLPAGPYTVILQGSHDTTGIGLIEVYNVN